METARSEQQNESSLRDLWDSIKCTNIRIMEGPRMQGEREGYQKCIQYNYGRKFPKPEEVNRYTGTGSTEGSKPVESKETHIKT